MKYAGMPMGMWVLFSHSFEKQLTAFFDYDRDTAGRIMARAKGKCKEILAAAGGASDFMRRYTLASGGPYCDCGYKRKK